MPAARGLSPLPDCFHSHAADVINNAQGGQSGGWGGRTPPDSMFLPSKALSEPTFSSRFFSCPSQPCLGSSFQGHQGLLSGQIQQSGLMLILLEVSAGQRGTADLPPSQDLSFPPFHWFPFSPSGCSSSLTLAGFTFPWLHRGGGGPQV